MPRLFSALFLIAEFTSLAATGALTIHVDMDRATPGIQTTRDTTAGENFEIDLVVEVDAAGVAAYAISVKVDCAELRVLSATESPPTPMISLATGVTITVSGDGTSILVSGFEAVTLELGPASSSFVAGTLSVQARSSASDSAPDVTPGYFSPGDGAFDNTLPFGQDLIPSTTLASATVSVTGTEPPVPAPDSQIDGPQEKVTVSWAAPAVPGSLVLQQSTTLAADSWTDSSLPQTLAGGTLSVTLAFDDFTRVFFRLVRPCNH